MGQKKPYTCSKGAGLGVGVGVSNVPVGFLYEQGLLEELEEN